MNKIVAAALFFVMPTMSATAAEDWRPVAHQCYADLARQARGQYGGVANVNGRWPDVARCVNASVWHAPGWVLAGCVGQVKRQYPNPPYPSSFDRLPYVAGCLRQ